MHVHLRKMRTVVQSPLGEICYHLRLRRLNIHASQWEIYPSDRVLNITVFIPLLLKYVACRLQHYHNYLRGADNAATIRGLKFFLPGDPLLLTNVTIASRWKEPLNMTVAHYMWDTIALMGDLLWYGRAICRNTDFSVLLITMQVTWSCRALSWWTRAQATNRNHAGATWLESHARIRLRPVPPFGLLATFLSLLSRGTGFAHFSRFHKETKKVARTPGPHRRVVCVVERSQSSACKNEAEEHTCASLHRDVGVCRGKCYCDVFFEGVFLYRYDHISGRSWLLKRRSRRDADAWITHKILINPGVLELSLQSFQF